MFWDKYLQFVTKKGAKIMYNNIKSVAVYDKFRLYQQANWGYKFLLHK